MNVAIYTDEELLKSIADGGSSRQRAIRHIYKDKSLESKVIRFVQNNSGNFQDGQDIFHEGIIVLDRNVRDDKFRGETTINGYLYSICRFLWMNQIRKKAKVDLTEDNSRLDDVEESTPEIAYMDEERKRILNQIIAKLNDRCRKILELWKLSYSMEEIAKELDFSSAAMARKNKYRCHKALMALLDEHPELTQILKN